MPHIDKRTQRSIAMLLPQSGAPVATGFLVEMRDEHDHRPKHVYLVTCEHCIHASRKARLSNGTVFEVTPSQWRISPDGHDVAVVEVTDHLPEDFYQEEFIPLGSMINEDLRWYGLGDEIFMLGLHVNEADTGTNAPRARFGNISAWATETLQGNGNIKRSHLGDMRSRTGFSGSPVFAYRETAGLSGYNNLEYRLLGIHSHQFEDRVQLLNDQQTYIQIPSSMTVIVPAWSLRFLVIDPQLRSMRKTRKSYPIAGWQD